MKTREEKVELLTKMIAQGGWSMIYDFVDKHATDDDFWCVDDDDEGDEVDSMRRSISQYFDKNE